MTRPIDAAALERLDEVTARAFGIKDGYLELNGIVSAAVGFDLFEELGLFDSPMDIVVARLRAELVARGQGEAALGALFEKLPGNAELREWVAAHCPAMLARVPVEWFEAQRSEYEANRMDRRVRVIEFQLRAIGGSVVLRGEQKALAQLVIQKLDELTDYKRIHDALHTLQMEVLGQLLRDAREDVPPAHRRDSMGVQIEQLRAAIDKIDSRFCDADEAAVSVGLRRAVVASLGQIVAVLTGNPPEAAETAEAAAGLLRALLRQQMSLFDSKLVEASHAIPFRQFAQLIRDLPQPAQVPTAVRGDPVLVRNVGNGFSDIETRLARRRTVHGLWQQVEATLLNIEELLRGAGRAIELHAHWRNLEALIGEITALSAEHGLLELPRPEAPADDAAALARAVRSGPYLSRFGFFAGQARVRFQRADTALVNDCEKLKRLQRPLQALLED